MLSLSPVGYSFAPVLWVQPSKSFVPVWGVSITPALSVLCIRRLLLANSHLTWSQVQVLLADPDRLTALPNL